MPLEIPKAVYQAIPCNVLRSRTGLLTNCLHVRSIRQTRLPAEQRPLTARTCAPVKPGAETRLPPGTKARTWSHASDQAPLKVWQEWKRIAIKHVGFASKMEPPNKINAGTPENQRPPNWFPFPTTPKLGPVKNGDMLQKMPIFFWWFKGKPIQEACGRGPKVTLRDPKKRAQDRLAPVSFGLSQAPLLEASSGFGGRTGDSVDRVTTQ